MGSGATKGSSGALIPVQAVYDLVGNLFNVQVGSMCMAGWPALVRGCSGALIPVQAVRDLVGNLCNVQGLQRALIPVQAVHDLVGNLFNVRVGQ
eukprot:1157646-Pelagomonas_calceolata.AAC.20